ncbi:molybdenum cofactor guanylyltransferase [Lysobacter olei]
MDTTDTEPPVWIGVVLAGGRSSRMGQDKARLTWRGQTLVEHACATMMAAGAARVVVSGDYPEWDGLPDATPDLGPLGGLASVFAAVPDGVLLLMPVDMPLVTPGLLRALASARASACVTFRDHVLPVRLQVDAHSRAVLAGLLGDPAGRRSLRTLRHALKGASIDLSPAQRAELVNCNTPDEWQAVSS